MRTMISYTPYPSKIPRIPTETSNSSHDDEDRQQPTPTSSSSSSPAMTPVKAPNVVTPNRPMLGNAETTEASVSSRKRKQHQHSQLQQSRQDSVDNTDATSTHSVDQFDLSHLMKHIERREWLQVVKFFEKFPQMPSQKAPSGNLPLHEALKHNPPLPVVNLMLEIHEGALRTTGAHGYLPLHVACNCRHIGVDVVTRLVVGHAGALRTREPTRDCLPLHLAVQSGVSEEVLMELLTNYPEASFVQDNLGKIPMDYAQESVHHHNRSIVALETAPILLAAAQAAQARVGLEYEFKVNGLLDAHKEYVRQLEERFEEERRNFMQEQIQFSNNLAIEKERNIALAEMLLEVKNSEVSLHKQHAELQEKFDQGMKEFRTLIETQEAELRLVLEEAQFSSDKSDSGVDTTTDRSLPSEDTIPNKSLKTVLQNLTKEFNQSKNETASLKEELLQQQELVRHLNEALTTRDEDISELRKKLDHVESSKERANELSKVHEGTLQDLAKTKQEINQLKLLSHENQNRLEKFKRTVRVQDNRFETVKSLVATLNYYLESWTDEEENGMDGESNITGLLLDKGEAHERSTQSTLGSFGDDVDKASYSGTTVLVTKIDCKEVEGEQSYSTDDFVDGNVESTLASEAVINEDVAGAHANLSLKESVDEEDGNEAETSRIADDTKS